MKKIILVLLVPMAIVAITSHQAQNYTIEFRQIGIYDPAHPERYNEERANFILQELRKGFRGKARELELEQARSLQQRATRAPTPDATELERLQQENAQLLAQNRELNERNQQLQQQIEELNQRQRQLLDLARNMATEHNHARAFTAAAGLSLQQTPPNVVEALQHVEEALNRIGRMDDLYNQFTAFFTT